MKFLILAGEHIHDDGLQYATGSIIETKSDLVKKFNSPGSEKFRRVEDSAPVTIPTNRNSIAPEGVVQKTAEEIFDEMDVDELRKFAGENKINVGKATSKEDLVRIIKANAKSLQPA